MPKKKSEIEALNEQHAEIYKEFLPTITRYSEMAARILEIQVKLFDRRLRDHFPEAEFTTAPHIVKISARETTGRLDALLAALSENSAAVGSIIYDPKAFEFHLYGINPTPPKTMK